MDADDEQITDEGGGVQDSNSSEGSSPLAAPNSDPLPTPGTEATASGTAEVTSSVLTLESDLEMQSTSGISAMSQGSSSDHDFELIDSNSIMAGAEVEEHLRPTEQSAHERIAEDMQSYLDFFPPVEAASSASDMSSQEHSQNFYSTVPLSPSDSLPPLTLPAGACLLDQSVIEDAGPSTSASRSSQGTLLHPSLRKLRPHDIALALFRQDKREVAYNLKQECVEAKQEDPDIKIPSQVGAFNCYIYASS